ncbi:MAG: maltose/moltooligosaccharide transporter [Flavobacteriales bacterium]
MKQKPELHFWQIWNMCFGFFGIQFGFALQNSNVSRIFQTLGAEIDDIPILWVAAPLTGLLVQPIIGYMSDNSRSRFGRRRPFFFIGAILASIALVFMPHSSVLWIAAGMLWIMDASLNIVMEPFRAFVGDMLPEKQRPLGYSLQSFFIGVGAVVASSLPWMFSNWLGFENTAIDGEISDSVRYSFYLGAAILFCAVFWTIFSTKEYTDEELRAFSPTQASMGVVRDALNVPALQFVLTGIIGTIGVYYFSLRAELYIITAGSAVYGVFLYAAKNLERANKTENAFFNIIYDLNNMPPVMKQLAVVQFFSWFALFSIWIYGTSAITSYHYGSSDVSSAAYNEGADWVGVLFSAYNGFAAIAAIVLPILARRIGVPKTHAVSLGVGAVSLFSFILIKDPLYLIISMFGVGFAWASILSLPYAMLSNVVPQEKMGLFMGIFNFFIVIPQLLAASILGLLIQQVFNQQPIYAFVLGGVCWVLAAIFSLRVKYSSDS